MNWIRDHLTQAERDELKAELNEKQLEFVTDYLKRGRRTVFANILAKEKAGSLEGGELDKVAEQWELIDYIDAGPRWRENPSLFCECGRTLRYQYILQNIGTGEMKKFGKDHFQEHTGIPASLAKEIVKGIEEVDFEIDEVLMKIANGWTLAHEGIDTVPSAIEIPKDIQQHLDVGVPLLGRQVHRLQRQLADYHHARQRERFAEEQRKREEESKRNELEIAKRSQELAEKMGFKNTAEQGAERLKLGTIVYLERLQDPSFKASDLCIYLVEVHGAPNARFSSGTLKVFPEVCSYLEELVEKGVLEFVEKYSNLDRAYRLVDINNLGENKKTDADFSQLDLFGDE